MNYFLGMGFLMFLGMVLGYQRRKAGWAAASRDYPALAERLGLEFRAPTSGAIGKLRGTYRGYHVIVDPDDLCRISLRFVTEPLVELRSYDNMHRSPEGLETFRSGDGTFDAYFRRRYGGDAVRETLQTTKGLGAMVEPFRNLRQVASLAISETGIECVFDYGRPPFIPARRVEQLLPRLVDLAKLVEPPALDVGTEAATPAPN